MSGLPPIVPLFLAFVVGLIVGRYFRFDGSTKLSFTGAPSGPDQSKGLLLAGKSTNLVLKCVCGASHKFHTGSGPDSSGAEPYPTGDAYVCTQCGKSIDFAKIRKLAGGDLF